MGPVAQTVKIFFSVFLAIELVLDVAIYILATALLCSKLIIPDQILFNDVIALIFAIVTLSIIHKGFQAVGHDCPYHLYWFAGILAALLFAQFMFQIFSLRGISSKWPPERKSLEIDEYDEKLHSERFQVEQFDTSHSKNFYQKNMKYRMPTAQELEMRKRKLYGGIPKIEKITTEPTKKYSLQVELIGDRSLPQLEVNGPLHPLILHTRKNEKSFQNRSEDTSSRTSRNSTSNVTPTNSTSPPEKLKKTPLGIVLSNYGLIMKLVCVAMAALTGFLFQLEYV